MTTFYVGHDGERFVGGDETRLQIAAVRRLRCKLLSRDGKPLSWDQLDDPGEPTSVLRVILADRESRFDKGERVAFRPPVAVVTADGNDAVRFEFYEGYVELKRTYDLRSAGLQGVKLPEKHPFLA